MSQTVLLILSPVASHSSTFCSLLNLVQQPAINVATTNNIYQTQPERLDHKNKNQINLNTQHLLDQ